MRLCVGMVSVASRVMFATKVSFKASQFDVHTLAGIIKVEILNQDPFYCEAMIGSPDYSTDKLAVEQEEPIIDQELTIHQKGIKITSLFMGTIHTVVFVEDALAELTRDVGEQILSSSFIQRENERQLCPSFE